MMKVNINSNYDPSESKDFNNNKVSDGWNINECEWKNGKIIELTTKHGISCNEYCDGHRCNDSWVATHAIMLDFDDGRMTKEMLLEKQEQWEFNSYVFSSQNHQKEKIGKTCDRLRVLIPLEEPIRSDLDLEAVKKALINKFPLVDKGCMDKARWFAHGTTEVSCFVGDKKFLNWRELLKLPNKTKKPVGRPKKDNNDLYTFNLETELKDKDRQVIKVKDIKEKTIIFCPVCGDAPYRGNESHNAFIDINDKGQYFIFCSSCKARGMGVSGEGIYNLNSAAAYLLKTKELRTAVFIDRNSCQHYSVSIENGAVVIDRIKNQYFAAQFCKSNNLPIPEYYPHARLKHKFDSDEIINFEKGFVNKYIAPDILKIPVPEGFKAKMPEYIGRLINHVFAGDREVIDHFINDLAYLVQTRNKLITSYLLQGTEGTGKGLLFKHVLRKIFGEKYCSETDMDAFDSRFNDFLTDNFLVLVSEVSANFTSSERRGLSIVEKIKMAITDQHIQIEGKGKDRQNGENNCSFLFATNRRHGIVLSNDDRRFNVAPRQEKKIQNANWWPGYVKLVKLLEEELQRFIWLLKSYPVNFDLIGTVIDNKPKQLLQAMSTTDAEDFFEAVNNGDADFLYESIVQKNIYNSQEKYSEMGQRVNKVTSGSKVSMVDLCELYNYINNKSLTNKRFTSLAKMYIKQEIRQLRENHTRIQGIIVNWHYRYDQEFFDATRRKDERWFVENIDEQADPKIKATVQDILQGVKLRPSNLRLLYNHISPRRIEKEELKQLVTKYPNDLAIDWEAEEDFPF